MCSFLQVAIKRKTCNGHLFDLDVENKTFFKQGPGVKLIAGNCFYRHLLETTEDTIDSYWGIINDTIFLIKPENIDFKDPQKIPFLDVNTKAGDRFTYMYMIQSEDLLMPADIIEVNIYDVSVEHSDTTYTLSHSIIPVFDPKITDRSFVLPRIKRTFTFSKKHGIIDFKLERFGDVTKLQQDW
ncbi:MAG: hypothetical protein EOP56_15715 [Sphingobacteriales bacterium]|nr:MAG: hypothetical protein EOP56_15715 [Sphingobacteriales bacterium]